MKLVSLNILGGKVFEPLMEFIRNHAPDTDIFCLQEIYQSSSGVLVSHGMRTHILDEIARMLPDFRRYFAPVQDGFVFTLDRMIKIDFDLSFGQATFVRKSFLVDSWGSFFVYRERNSVDGVDFETLPANVLYTRIRSEDKLITVSNLHGLGHPGHKLDTESRLEQSRKIKQFLDKESGAKILCGDFNLFPETQSMKMLEENMTNLVKTHKIERTRSRLSPWWGKDDFQKFADYVLVSPEVHVLHFEVPDVDVSDHLPLVLEFS